VSHTFDGPPPHDSPTHRRFSSDHISGDRKDNSIQNLRYATNEEQLTNRGIKRVDRLDPDEPRQLMKPPKKAKESVRKVQYGTPKSLLVYNQYVSSDDSLDAISSAFGHIAISTVRGYISQHYKSQDAETIIEKSSRFVLKTFAVQILSSSSRKSLPRSTKVNQRSTPPSSILPWEQTVQVTNWRLRSTQGCSRTFAFVQNNK